MWERGSERKRKESRGHKVGRDSVGGLTTELQVPSSYARARAHLLALGNSHMAVTESRGCSGMQMIDFSIAG
jgi:hypothetical protein